MRNELIFIRDFTFAFVFMSVTYNLLLIEFNRLIIGLHFMYVKCYSQIAQLSFTAINDISKIKYHSIGQCTCLVLREY